MKFTIFTTSTAHRYKRATILTSQNKQS